LEKCVDGWNGIKGDVSKVIFKYKLKGRHIRWFWYLKIWLVAVVYTLEKRVVWVGEIYGHWVGKRVRNDKFM